MGLKYEPFLVLYFFNFYIPDDILQFLLGVILSQLMASGHTWSHLVTIANIWLHLVTSGHTYHIWSHLIRSRHTWSLESHLVHLVTSVHI